LDQIHEHYLDHIKVTSSIAREDRIADSVVRQNDASTQESLARAEESRANARKIDAERGQINSDKARPP